MDHDAAQKEIDCIIYCTMTLDDQLQNNNYEQASTLIKDMKNSLNTLQLLIKAKEEKELINGIVSRLKEIGVDSTIVARYFDNKKAE